MFSNRAVLPMLLLFCCAALLSFSGCVVAPIAFHDGFPAWTPAPGQADASIGYHGMFWFIEGEVDNVQYLTPGMRMGLGSPPMVADAGLASVVISGSVMLGPSLGIGYQTPGLNVVFRPSAYVLGIGGGGIEFGAWWQLCLMAEKALPDGRARISGGGRMSELGVGPVMMFGYTLGPVQPRVEASYMFPNSQVVEGRVLTVGLTVGAAPPKALDDSYDGAHW